MGPLGAPSRYSGASIAWHSGLRSQTSMLVLRVRKIIAYDVVVLRYRLVLARVQSMSCSNRDGHRGDNGPAHAFRRDGLVQNRLPFLPAGDVRLRGERTRRGRSFCLCTRSASSRQYWGLNMSFSVAARWSGFRPCCRRRLLGMRLSLLSEFNKMHSPSP